MALSALLLVGAGVGAEMTGCRAVTYAELLQAMQGEQGYDATATTSAVRFQVGTLLRLARSIRALDPDQRPLYIRYDTWSRAYLAVNHLAEDEAPLFLRLAQAHQQDIWVDYARERVLQRCTDEAKPDVAMNVKYWWAETPGSADSFTFEDVQSVPRLKVVNMRVITYRVLQFRDMVVCDDIDGLGGRPLSGLLGLMFRIIGEGRVVESRIALTPDGLQIVRAHARKGPAGLWTTATVFPDGRAVKGLPPNRDDLESILSRMKRRLKISYQPFPD